MDKKPLGNIDFQYDPAADVLYCSFGPPQEAIGVEVNDGVIVRRHPETNAVVGLTIIDFSRRFTQHPENYLSVPLEPVLEMA